MINLKTLFGGGKDEAAADPLQPLLAEASTATQEREVILVAIERTNTKLAEARQQWLVARERVAAEEVKAAEEEDGLAVASEAARQGEAKARLLAKSADLHLKKLNADLKAINERILGIADRIRAAINEQLEAAKAEVRTELDSSVEQFANALFKVMALVRHGGPRDGADFYVGANGLGILAVFNPIGSSGSGVIRNGCFTLSGERSGSLTDNWQIAPDARALDTAIVEMKRRAEPIAALAKAIRGE